MLNASVRRRLVLLVNVSGASLLPRDDDPMSVGDNVGLELGWIQTSLYTTGRARIGAVSPQHHLDWMMSIGPTHPQSRFFSARGPSIVAALVPWMVGRWTRSPAGQLPPSKQPAARLSPDASLCIIAYNQDDKTCGLGRTLWSKYSVAYCSYYKIIN